ncbi:MAG: hypothetical protein Q9224_007446, partial [Gallowayella concinna]
ATKTVTALNTRNAARVWVDGIQAVPNVAKTIWPDSPLNQQQIDISDNRLIDGSTTVDMQLGSGLKLLMSDLSEFLAFTDKGRFTAQGPPPDLSIADRGADTSIGRNTFLTSKLMEKTGFYAIPGAVINETNNPTCQDGSNETGRICKADNWVYRSPTTRRTYTLMAKAPPQNTPQMKIDDLVAKLNEGLWADRELLFDGNYNCTLQGRAGREIAALNAQGKMDVSCVSQLPMYLDCGTPCPTGAVLVGRICPFGNWQKC